MSEPFSWPTFLRQAVAPSLGILVLPLFALWFSAHVEGSWNDSLRTEVVEEIRADAALSEAERGELIAQWMAMDFGAVCADASEDTAGIRTQLADICAEFWQMGVMWQASALSLLLGVLTGLVLSGLALLAFLNRTAGFLALRAGWLWLQLSSASQIVLQGGLAVALSFWITAFWFNMYIIKLIGVIAVLVAMGMWSLLKALFTREEPTVEVTGELLDAVKAPALWARVRELAATAGTAPPDRLVAGIDDNFFVTEVPVVLDGARLDGRTLFISLSLLRALDRREADAVLAHEMAHFAGDDATWTRRFAPLRQRYVATLQALYDGITLPLAWPMISFLSLLDLAQARQSRERELAADATAARIVAPEAIATSLIKVSAWATFRNRVQAELFAQDRVLAEVGIAERVRGQFRDYARSERLSADLSEGHTPHPLDSHPPNPERIAAVGVDLPEARWQDILLRDTGETWMDASPGLDAVEARLWAAFEQQFAAAHEFHLALRYAPAGDQERAIVERHFPACSTHLTSGDLVVASYVGLTHPQWDPPLRWADVASMSIEDRWGGKALEIVAAPGAPWTGTRSIKLSELGSDADTMLAAINRLWGRDQFSRNARA